MAKKISIIIPCYEVEQYIDRCYQSLIRQTIGLENLELIFVNDASPDHTLDKLLQYEQQYPDSIIVINSEENLKQGGARNLGMQYASADYIGFVDSDDWVDETMFEKLYHKATQYDCDVVTCRTKRVFDENEPMGPTGESDAFYIIDAVDSRKELLISQIYSGEIYTKLYKKSLIFDNDIFFPQGLKYEDNFFAVLVELYVKRLYILEEYLYYYFVNYSSTIMAPGASHHFDRLTIELMKLDEFKNRGLFELYYHEIEFNFLLLYYFNTLHIIMNRFQEIPLETINKMRYEVKRNFPEYKSNPYIPDYLINLYKALMITIDTPLDQEAWNQLAVKYKTL